MTKMKPENIAKDMQKVMHFETTLEDIEHLGVYHELLDPMERACIETGEVALIEVQETLGERAWPITQPEIAAALQEVD